MNSTGQPGHCALRGSCGTKGWIPKPLPCPYDGPAQEPENEETRRRLVNVCGVAYSTGPVCCTSDQLDALRENLDQAENLIASCPACRNNFRDFFCAFTCSPNQATFLNVTSTQQSSTGQLAVKSTDFFVATEFASGFFDSCKNVQVGATNGYAMDLIGGGAKDYAAFLKYMGDEKPIGSPFQINYPAFTPPEFTSFDSTPRNCADNDLASHCTCIDCPTVCKALPYIPAPGEVPACHVGQLTCLSFILIVGYGLAVLAFVLYVVQVIRSLRKQTQESVALSADTSSPRIHPRGLVGAGSLAHYLDGDDFPGTHSESRHLSRGVSLLDPIDAAQPRHYRLNTVLRRTFYKLGLFAASSPWLTFSVVFLVIGTLNFGWRRFEVETDPVRLWVAPNSESRLQKEFFDEHFGPFYRVEQIFLTSASSTTLSRTNDTAQDLFSSQQSPVVTWDHLKYWSDVEAKIRNLVSYPNGYHFTDVCFKPAGPEGACVVQSALAWFGNDLRDYDENTWADRLLKCAHSPVDCLPDFMQPLGPQYVLGGVPVDHHGRKQYLEAEALVFTYVVSDSLDPAKQAMAMEWEQTLRAYLWDLSLEIRGNSGLEMSFSTGVSLEEEINKSTNTDIKIVVLSYLAMFLYISVTLGSNPGGNRENGMISSLRRWVRNSPQYFTRSSEAAPSDQESMPTIFPRLPRRLFVGSKVTLGLFSICLVLLSISSSVGLFSLLGVKVTLVIAEVIPFLVLAVGVDNVFILVHELHRQNNLHGPNASAASHNPGFQTPMSPEQSHRSPFDSSQDDSTDARSMPQLLSAEERVARTLAKMGPSILLSSVTETVAFALGALVPMPAVRNFALYASGSVLLNAVLQVTVLVSALAIDLRRVEASRVDCFPCIRLPPRIALPDPPVGGSGMGKVSRFIRRYYAPFLLRPVVKGVVLLFFAGTFVASVISMQYIQLGFDQRLALPSDSYLIPYFDDLDAYLDVGPPVYFVTTNVDVVHRPGQQALCGRFTTCNDFSVANVLEAERKRPESSFISQPSASWVDDFLSWLDPGKSECCRVRKRNPSMFCRPRDPERLCQPCYLGKSPSWNITMEGFPEDGEFMRYLQQWLDSPTTEACPLSGKASFGTALSLSENTGNVVASHFRTFHSPLKSQADFINAFAAAHRIAEDISQRTGTTVFPYSMFYVFFDQYAHIIAITQYVLGLGLGAVLVVTALFLGSWRTGTIVTGVVALTVVTVMGVMAPFGVSLNAISLVNLVISLGIAVEFCAHIARAFMSTGSGLPVDHPAGQKERDERIWMALVDVGPSVLSGITFTKLIGMCVLGLTRSKFLEIYYFRMWLALIVSGALHGLVLLPVILSVGGASGFPQQEADEEWMSIAIRDDYEHAPLLADDDSIGGN